uniref:Uncharacterized protein n=1 Tax=Meloidogyne incognita TaxID=6306 RepID=A0A914MZH3_MELIC
MFGNFGRPIWSNYTICSLPKVFRNPIFGSFVTRLRISSYQVRVNKPLKTIYYLF